MKNKTGLGNAVPIKGRIPKDLTSDVVHKFHCVSVSESCHAECVRGT